MVVVPLAGCGSESAQAGGSAPGAAPTSSPTTATVRGRLKLDVPISGATVTAVDTASGQALSPTVTTDAGGFFHVEVPLQGAFTLQARVDQQGVAEAYARCYDGLPPARYLTINGLTTVAARYRQLHPSLSAASAETRVKQALGVPGSLDAGLGAHAHAVSNFAHSAFVRAARAYPGGEPAYVDALASGLATRAKGSGVTSGSQPSLADSSQSFYSLLSELSFPLSSETDAESSLRPFSLSSASFSETLSTVSSSSFSSLSSLSSAAESAGAETAEHVLTSAFHTVLYDLANDVVSSVIGIGIEALFAAIFPSNPNQDVLEALQGISSQISQLQDSVTQLTVFIESAFQSSDYQTNSESVRSAFATIDNVWSGPDNVSGYAGALNQAAAGGATNVQTGLNALSNILPNGLFYQSPISLANAKRIISSAQLGSSPGSPSLMAQFRDLVSPSAGGGGGYRYASNLSLNQMYGQWSQLAAYQLKAAQVIACLARAGVGSGPDFQAAADVLKSTMDQIQQQRTQLPFPMPDDKIIFDTESGLVLYGELFPAVPIGSNLNYFAFQGNWPYVTTTDSLGGDTGVATNPDPAFPWSSAPPAPFGAADLAPGTWVLPTAGMLWTFLDPNRQTYSGAQYSAHPQRPNVPYLNVLQQYGFTPDSVAPWTFVSLNILFNFSTSGQSNFPSYLTNPAGSVHGPEQLPYPMVITTGYNSPWNAMSLADGTVLPNIDNNNSPSGSVYTGQTQQYAEQTADNQTVAPYVLMADAAPSDASPHPDLSLLNIMSLANLANQPVNPGAKFSGLHCATNRAFFGAGKQQAAAVAFSGTQLVALAAEQPGPNPDFGLVGNSVPSLSAFINQFYGGRAANQYVEGPAGIDNDIDTSFGGQQLLNTCWDLTPYLYWTSSNPTIADVSNAPGRIGQIIRRGGAPGGVVTFTGTRVELNRAGSVGNPVTVTCQFTFQALPAATLTAIFPTPNFQTVHVQGPKPQTRVFAVGQFSDGTSPVLPNADPSGQPPVPGVTWTTSDPAVIVGTDGSVTVTGPPAQPTVTITARQGAVSSAVNLTVLNP